MKAKIIISKGSALCRGCRWGKYNHFNPKVSKLPKPIPKGDKCLQLQVLQAGPPGTMYAYYCKKHALKLYMNIIDACWNFSHEHY